MEPASASAASPQLAVCLRLTQAIAETRTVDEIYAIALDALAEGLGITRAAILLVDGQGVMRFAAHRQLSERYRQAMDGHSPWRPDSASPGPLIVADVTTDDALAEHLSVIRHEGIAAMTSVPIVSRGRVIGTVMLYFETPREPAPDDLQLASIVAAQVGFAAERLRNEAEARRNESRMRFALQAASMGTWDWDLRTQQVQWSDNLETLHGLPAGSFDGTFASYEREIHPADRETVVASAMRAAAHGIPHDIEYRILAPDGTIRWVEGKGNVEYEQGVPVRVTGVCMMVTRRKEAELARLAAAEEASRLKDEFLATLSHELRTPLNAIVGWVQMMGTGTLTPERTQQAIEVIARNARLQSQLIEDILDISRIIAGKLEVEPFTVVVPPLIDTVVSGVLPAARLKDIHVEATVPDDLPPIPGDPKRLHQVLSNLLSNAVKFTPEHGRIDVRCAVDGDWLRIDVRDTGVGIDPAFLPFVFERFRQADSRATRRHGGLGLGLAITRHIVTQHHGEIVAASAGIGLGTTMTVRLPLGFAEPGDRSGDSAGPASSMPALELHGITVVVVDDQRDARDLLAELFEQCGARVIRCASAHEAQRAVATADVRLLVADIAMPEVDGYELIRSVRRTHDRLPAIAVSAYARPQDRQQAQAAGFNGYCAKPIDASVVLDTVADVLSLR